MQPKKSSFKEIVSWSFYDWANSAFATTIMAGFFPIFFKKYWSQGVEVTVSTFRLGLANSIGGILIALLAPILGAIADKGNCKKKFLFYFAFLGILSTGFLYLVSSGNWGIAILFYVLAVIGFSGGNIFYDALLVLVSPKDKLDMVSSLGYALGYLGGGLLFALNVLMTLKPQLFGLPNEIVAIRVSFILVALWWGIFSIPLFLAVREKKNIKDKIDFSIISAGFKQLFSTLRNIRQSRVVFLFLIAYWFYIDGVDTIMRMAVDYGLSLGFNEKNLITALLITQFVGFPAAILFGKIGEKIGAKSGIFIAIGVYIIVTIWSFFMQQVYEFYILAIIIGLVQGGIQALSRSFYIRLIPENKAAEFLGFYNMLGKFAVFLGPVLMGWIGLLLGSPRYSVFAITFLLAVGGISLYFVDEKKGAKLALKI